MYLDRAVQPGTAMTAHGDEVRLPSGAGPFLCPQRCAHVILHPRTAGLTPDRPTYACPTHTRQRGGANSDVLRCKIIKWFRPGEAILITPDRMRAIFLALLRFRNELFREQFPPRYMV